MEEIRIEVKGEKEKIKIKRIISELYGDVSFPGKDGSDILLIRASFYTINVLDNLSKIKIVEHKPMLPLFFAKKAGIVYCIKYQYQA